ncbi:cysteine/serine-rich nuclear protein 1-like isoform X5 [Myxocyprinus asiaticus]|uniref:cysteine/serine-rich nuclear protein 1-like isoform X5 n=1 Tax=Myxocyprinus asiaticus TaxID=70543 RepID=UPI0022217A1B|nr:cysteine/serine-rich nuclear protein 1-like isoform X5 [Myxocyprinus asiaticus]
MRYGYIITGYIMHYVCCTEKIAMATLQRGGLKRKYGFSEEDAVYYSSSPSSHSEWDSDEDGNQSDTVDFGPIGPFPSSLHMPISSILKKTKNTQSKGSVGFGLVTVFFFQRCQGFISVPSHGGCTLGMVSRHAACQQFTLTEHAEEQQRLRLKRLRERHEEERLEALRQRLISSGTHTIAKAASLTLNNVPDEDVDLINAKLKDGESFRPYSSKRRHALLRAAGVVRIDREEKRQLQELRKWREDCGCHCQGFCDPGTCACSQAGIKCQMDRTNFPCGCSKEGCGNPVGRIEFNSSCVRSHYIHTHMKLELEKRQLDKKFDQKRLITTEQQSDEVNRAITFPIDNDSSPFPSLLPSPAFHLSSGLCREEENSCSSDMTDTSCSSSLSLDSEVNGSPPSERPTLDVDDRGLAHILSFSDPDGDECPYIKECNRTNMQQSLSKDLSTEAAGSILGLSTKDNTQSESNISTSQLECLDENANQVTMEFVSDPCDIPNTPSPSSDNTANCDLDLSLSSDSDLLFFDSFHEYGPSYNHFKVYSHMDYMSHIHFPSCPSPAQIEDSGVSLLESLVGIS